MGGNWLVPRYHQSIYTKHQQNFLQIEEPFRNTKLDNGCYLNMLYYETPASHTDCLYTEGIIINSGLALGKCQLVFLLACCLSG